jgi:hypothetical protein
LSRALRFTELERNKLDDSFEARRALLKMFLLGMQKLLRIFASKSVIGGILLCSGKVAVQIGVFLVPLEIVPGDKVLNPLLDSLEVRL